MSIRNGQRKSCRDILRLVPMCGLMLASVLVFASPNALAQEGAAAPKASGNVANGKRLYASNRCWMCHNNEAQGGNGPRIGPTNLSLAGVIAYIRHPKGQMPPYIPSIVSDAEVADIYAYLESLPKPPSAKSIPLLNGN
jgi:mono/diheme cytochrome c family protein